MNKCIEHIERIECPYCGVSFDINLTEREVYHLNDGLGLVMLNNCCNKFMNIYKDENGLYVSSVRN